MYECMRLLNHSNKEIIRNFVGQLLNLTKCYQRKMQRRGWWLICTAVDVAGLQALLHKMLCFSSPEYKCVHAMHGCPKVSKRQADNE